MRTCRSVEDLFAQSLTMDRGDSKDASPKGKKTKDLEAEARVREELKKEPELGMWSLMVIAAYIATIIAQVLGDTVSICNQYYRRTW